MDQLLSTKLHIPAPRPALVRRPRLIDKLNEGLHRKLALISAPAGFGKTTLLSEWMDDLRLGGAHDSQTGHRIGWLSLDEGDNDLARFLAYFIAALNRIHGTKMPIGTGALDMIQFAHSPPIEAILTSLINDVAGIPEQNVLVLDDYHVISSSLIDDALTFLLEHLPPKMQLVLATRDDPLLPLARLRSQDQVTELRAKDLRFSSYEVSEFLNQVMGLSLSAENISTLETRTEGWIAGLQLAAISMRGNQDATGFVESFSGSHRLVLDYLIEEVLNQQPAGLHDFLLQTAVLDRLSGPLCDAITGHNNSQATLEKLEHSNLFIVPLDEERRWYRYHQLFADLLRQRLQHLQPERIQPLQNRASEWYAQNGFPNEAIEHALRARNFEQAADLLANNVDDVWQPGEHVRLRRWLDELPDDVICSKPHLCILHAANLFTSGQVDEADQRLRVAEQALGAGPTLGATNGQASSAGALDPDHMKFWGRAATVRAHLISYHGEVEEAIECAELALEYLPESDSTWRWSALDCVGTVYSSIDDESAYQARTQALEAGKAAGNIYLILLASLRLVVTLRDLGRLQQAIGVCQKHALLADGSVLSQTALVGWLYSLWGEMLAERNELASALQLVRKGVVLTEKGSDVTLLGSSYLCLMRALYSSGALENAKDFIQGVDAYTPKHNLSPWIVNQMAAWQARICVVQGDLDCAAAWAERCELDADGELTPMHDFGYAVLARIFIAQGRLEEASRLLTRLLEAARAGGRTARVIEIQILQALALHALGDEDHALTTLAQALTLAEPEGFVRIFLDEGPPIVTMLHKAVNTEIVPDYARRLLAALPASEPAAGNSASHDALASVLFEALSERECEVLQLIAKGLTNQQIASRLFLSPNTIKVHTRNIYGKLSVNNRIQAVSRAIDLGILTIH